MLSDANTLLTTHAVHKVQLLHNAQVFGQFSHIFVVSLGYSPAGQVY
jgi:hypothetical protein